MADRLQIFIWTHGDDVLNERILHSVSEDDLERAEKMQSQRRRQDFLLGRYLLQTVFQSQFNVSPGFQCLYENDGKPYLLAGPEFSLSHTQGYLALAVHATQRVGVDIELTSDKRDALAILQSYGTDEEVAWFTKLDESERPNAFYKLWSMKEAYSKAHGQGLHMGLQNLNFDFASQRIVKMPVTGECRISYLKQGSAHLAACLLGASTVATEIWQVKLNEDQIGFVPLENTHPEEFVGLVPGIAANY